MSLQSNELNEGASDKSDRAVVNGAASVSAVPASIPSAARNLDEWHEDCGDVVWWRFPVEEAAWIGSPNDSDWPGYHTHWTPHPPIPLEGGK